jgi:transaldolase
MQDLAGIDVMTVPPKVAHELLSLNLSSEKIVDRTGMNYKAGFSVEEDPEAVRLGTLWEVDEQVVACVDALETEDLDSFTPDDLVGFFKEHGCGDVLVDWKHSQIATSAAEGKIPKLKNWQETLADKSIGLDSLMNLAGLNSFTTDQKAMDQRVRDVLAGRGMTEAVKTGRTVE